MKGKQAYKLRETMNGHVNYETHTEEYCTVVSTGVSRPSSNKLPDQTQPARSLGSSAAGACMCKITVQKETVYLTAGTNSHIQGLVFSPLSYPQPCFLNNCDKIHVTVTHFKCTISTF